MMLLWAVSAAQGAPQNVAVFNFQMKQGPQQWQWLEKGLADQIATDFCQSRRINVIARDEMQLVASRLKWAPEMATRDRQAMSAINARLKLEWLVTGTYSIEGQKIEIVAQVINVADRREMARKTVSGPAKEVLGLQKSLSAELLSFFSGAPAEQILPHLPLWCRNLQASATLYEGVHLYDLGQYAEAWLKFRQALRNDGSYIEARYWIARMYYFMDRYDHARRAYDEFFYHGRGHPRAGDAMREYLHTYEKLGTPPREMIALYEDFQKRFPKVLIFNELDSDGPIEADIWLRVRIAQARSLTGDSAAAARGAAGAIQQLRRLQNWDEYDHGADRTAYRLALSEANLHYGQTGRNVLSPPLMLLAPLVPPRRLEQPQYPRRHIVQFDPGKDEMICQWPRNMSLAPIRRGEQGSYRFFNVGNQLWVTMLPQNGQLIRSLTVYPIVDERYSRKQARVHLGVHSEYPFDAGQSSYVPLQEAIGAGVTVDNLPRRGILHFSLGVYPENIPGQSTAEFLFLQKYRLKARIENIGPHGTLDVQCSTTDRFTVYVDGEVGRRGPGRVDLLACGRHTLTFRQDGVLAPQQIQAVVTQGQVTPVAVALDWDRSGPWKNWSRGVRVGGDYPAEVGSPIRAQDAPAIQADASALRIVWHCQGDLWMSTSGDGERFSPPARLPLPISTAWTESDPRCFRDDSGRLMLTFLSDREGQHRPRPYACWSRDGLHWSRPAMMVDQTIGTYDVCAGHRGGMAMAWFAARGQQRGDAGLWKICIATSPEGLAWQEKAQLPLPAMESFWVSDLRLMQRRGGGFELLAAIMFGPLTKVLRWELDDQFHSLRPVPDVLASYPQRLATALSLSADEDGLALVAAARGSGCQSRIQLMRCDAEGVYRISRPLKNACSGQTALSYHPRWGYMLAWQDTGDDDFSRRAQGPYFTRSSSLGDLMGAAPLRCDSQWTHPPRDGLSHQICSPLEYIDFTDLLPEPLQPARTKANP